MPFEYAKLDNCPAHLICFESVEGNSPNTTYKQRRQIFVGVSQVNLGDYALTCGKFARFCGENSYQFTFNSPDFTVLLHTGSRRRRSVSVFWVHVLALLSFRLASNRCCLDIANSEHSSQISKLIVATHRGASQDRNGIHHLNGHLRTAPRVSVPPVLWNNSISTNFWPFVCTFTFHIYYNFSFVFTYFFSHVIFSITSAHLSVCLSHIAHIGEFYAPPPTTRHTLVLRNPQNVNENTY